MPTFNIVKNIAEHSSFRVEALKGMFDLDSSKVQENFVGNIPIENINWNVGIICGRSGTGKSSIAKELWPKNYVRAFEYSARSILDDMPKTKSMKEITNMFSSVGFSSPPSWMKPYSVLSNGEKMRVDLAHALLCDNDLIVFDEFTSVVDRQIAKVGSVAISKAIKRTNKKFIAVSCHSDIIEWLEPDWIFHTNEMRFENCTGLLQRPEINISIRKCSKELWSMFRKYHYLSSNILGTAICFVALLENNPVAFGCCTPLIHNTIQNGFREHRVVVLPDYQGIGIGNRLSDFVASLCAQKGFRYFSTTSSPAMINARLKNSHWRMSKDISRCNTKGKNSTFSGHKRNRLTTSWEYSV